MKPRITLLLKLLLALLAASCSPISPKGESADLVISTAIPPPLSTWSRDEGVVTQPPTAAACTHSVAPGGGDANPGTEAQPWATFQHAADSAQPGDTVCFRQGVYAVDEVRLSISGVEGASITFIAHPGERPTLDGEGRAAELLIVDRGVAHLRLSGFELRGYRIWGLRLSGDNHHIQLDHLDIGGGEAGVRLTYAENAEAPPEEGTVQYVTLEDSVVHDSQYSAIDCTPGPCDHTIIRRVEVYGTGLIGESFYGSDGIEFARGYPILVEDCYVHDNGGDGIDLNSRDREGHVGGVVVRRNRVVRNHLNGIKLWAGGLIENNLLWGQGNSAIWVGTWPGTVEVVNNTVAYNMWDPAYSERNWALVAGYPEEMEAPSVALTLVNNLFAFNADPMDGGPTGIYLGPGVTLVHEGYNLFFSRADEEITAEFLTGNEVGIGREEIADGTWTQISGQGQGDQVADPRFVAGWAESGPDLHLLPGSPGLNAGAANRAPADDLEGRRRDVWPDLGAYESAAQL